MAQEIGKNGVALGAAKEPGVVKRLSNESKGHRTYEVHQRERVGESTEKIKPVQLVGEDYRLDPYPLLATLRTYYPFYRDWLANSYWVTRYNDVTSIFVDDANFESRSKCSLYGLVDFGRDFGQELSLLEAQAQITDATAPAIAQNLIVKIAERGEADLAKDFAGEFSLRLRAEVWGMNASARDDFSSLYWRMQRGTSWHPALQQDGLAAIYEMETFIAPLIKQRRANPGDDVLSILCLNEDLTARDVVATLLESDHETMHGTLANLWFALLSDPTAYASASSNARLMKLAYLETLRHSPPILSAHRFARHEVERFGKLIPEGARLVCSAAAANRDPDVFLEPDKFIVDRKDLCQREPRGQYRADGLATGISFGLGKPTRHPAVPEDRPRSHYALTRDTAVAASMALAEGLPNLRLKTFGKEKQAVPRLTALTVGEMHTCWHLPVDV